MNNYGQNYSKISAIRSFSIAEEIVVAAIIPKVTLLSPGNDTEISIEGLLLEWSLDYSGTESVEFKVVIHTHI